MNKTLLALGCTLLIFSQASIAGTTINGSIHGTNGGTESGSVGVGIGADGNGTNGGNGVNVVINGQNSNSQQSGASGSQANKNFYASICSSPFMKKYAAICK